MVRRLLQRLRYPNAAIECVSHLVREHMFHYTEDWSDSAVRRFIMRVGEDNIEPLFKLRRADAYATTGNVNTRPELLAEFGDRIEALLARGKTPSMGNLAVKGADLIAMGIVPGPQMGIILRELLDAVVDDPALNTRERLLDIASRLAKRYYAGA
jgi:hypothetical protein